MPGEFILVFAGRRLSGWRLWIAASIGVLVIAGVAALAFALFLIVAPILAAMIGWQVWRIRRAQRRGPPAQWRDALTIEASYEVLDDHRRDGQRKGRL
jgi:hypothetical protein